MHSEKPEKIKKSIKHRFLAMFAVPLILLLVVLGLFIANYKPDTYLIGWDNLLPELNMQANIERHTTSAWQEFQGVGMETGIALGADLPRVAIISLLQQVMPNNMVRYAYMFLCVYLGSLGIYYLFRWLLKRDIIEQKWQLSELQIQVISLITALFYLFNHGTLEVFYAPIETFPSQWAWMPWLFLVGFKVLLEQKLQLRYVFLFGLVNILAAPAAQVPTTFLVYFAALILAIIIICLGKIKAAQWKPFAKRGILLILVTLICNSFWLIPFASFTLSGGSQTVQNSSVNQIFTEDIYYRNAVHGELKDVALLRGYLYDTYDINKDTSKFEPMMKPWISHYDSGLVEIIGYFFFGISLLGLIFVFVKKEKLRFVYLGLFLFSLFFLINSNAPTGGIFEFLRNTFPVFKEAFRFPYTKILQLAILIYSILFGYGLLAIFLFLRKLLKFDVSSIIIIFFVFALVTFAGPSFSGNFIDNELKLKIPSEYFQMFDYFKTQPSEARIADLPQADVQNWFYTDWGYRGSGFLWYGLKQPVLDRAFDNWSKYNEDYFWQINQAIYSNNVDALAKIMDKYQVGWLVYDKHVILDWTDNDNHQKYYNEQFIPKVLADGRFEQVATFEDKIMVISYKPTLEKPGYLAIGSNKQQAAVWDYQSLGNEIKVDQAQQKLTISKDFDRAGELIIPAFASKSNYQNLVFTVLAQDQDKVILGYNLDTPQILLNGNNVIDPISRSIAIPSQSTIVLTSSIDTLEITPTLLSGNTENKLTLAVRTNDQVRVWREIQSQDLSAGFNAASVANCVSPESAKAKVDKQPTVNGFSLTAENAVACTYSKAQISNQNSLVGLKFNYQSATDDYPAVCVSTSNRNEFDCIPEVQINSLKSALIVSQQYHNYFSVNKDKLMIWLNLYSKLEENKHKELAISNIQLEQYQNISQFSTTELLPAATTVTINSGDQLQVNIPIISGNAISATADLLAQASLPSINCNGATKTGLASKVELGYTNSAEGLVYKATNADNCNVIFNRDRLPLDSDYLITTTAKNIQGYPLEMRIKNKDLDYFREKVLLKNSNDNQSQLRTILIPARTAGSIGLQVEIHNYSRGQFSNQNNLESFTVQNIQANYLTGINFIEANVPENTLEITDTHRLTAYLYRLKVKGKGTLVLNQGFDPGWVAFDNLANHVIWQGWANSWSVDKEKVTEVYLVFLPQIGQLLGYVLMFIAFYYLVLVSLWRKRKK